MNPKKRFVVCTLDERWGTPAHLQQGLMMKNGCCFLQNVNHTPLKYVNIA